MIDPQELSAIDDDIYGSPDLVGQECSGCRRILVWKFFDHDSSYRTGYKPTCISCKAAPRLSMEEHVDKLSTENYNSEGTRRQRHADQEEFRRETARWGKTVPASDFLMKLKKLVPELVVRPGGIVGDLGLYMTAPGPQKKWDGKDFQYMGYVTLETMPEHSIFEFDEKLDIVLRPIHMGWRSTLIRFIKAGILTEAQCEKEFGLPSSGNSALWFKQLWSHRNEKVPETVAS
jgi:hypothetical protein